MRILVCLIALLAISLQACWAVPELNFEVPDGEQAIAQASPEDILVDLDPASPIECVPALLLFRGALKSASVCIDEGDYTRTISKNCMLTAAEYFAAREILTGEDQQLTLSEKGTATAGEVYLDPYITQRCRSLSVPAGMTAIQSVPHLPRSIKVEGRYFLEAMSATVRLRANRIHVGPGAVVACKTGCGFSRLALDENKRLLVVDNSQPAADCGYQLKKIVRSLVKNSPDEELVPLAGQTKAIEARIHGQERMSCQPRHEEAPQEPILVHSKRVPRLAGAPSEGHNVEGVD